MTLVQEAGIKLREYEGLNDDDPPVMQISSILQSKVMATQGDNCQSGNTQNVNQGQNINAPSCNWKANLVCL